MTDTNEASFLRIVREAITEIVPAADRVNEGTQLIGEAAVVDSVGFITLLVAIEHRLDGHVDLAASFLEHGMADNPTNPFLTVGSLTRHLRTLRDQLAQ
jgi:hypothetical protein